MRNPGILILTLALLAPTTPSPAADAPAPAAAAAPSTRPAPPFTFAKDTTYFIRPLRRDGTIDYAAALNEHLGKGVPAADNAAIPLLDAITAAGEGQKVHYARLRALLGVPGGPAPAAPDLPLGPPDPRASSAPWAAKDLPDTARWLESVDKQMNLAVEASRRGHYHLPLVRERQDDFLPAVLLPHLAVVRQLANGLRARAMLRLGSDDPDGFIRDALAVVRLGRLSTHSATLIEKLVAIACESIGLEAIRTAATGGWLSEQQAAALLAELRKAPPARPMSDSAAAERAFLLEVLQHGAVHGAAEAEKALGQMMQPNANADRLAIPAVAPVAKDWDAAMRKANAWFDRLEAIGRKPTYAEREQAGRELETDAAALKKKSQAWNGVFAPLEDRALAVVLPPVTTAYRRETRVAAERSLTELALALSAYKSQKEVYPPTLKPLFPDDADAEPTDPFTGKPFAYRSTGTAYVLRTPGPDGADDPGPRGDDIIVRAGE